MTSMVLMVISGFIVGAIAGGVIENQFIALIFLLSAVLVSYIAGRLAQ